MTPDAEAVAALAEALGSHPDQTLVAGAVIKRLTAAGWTLARRSERDALVAAIHLFIGSYAALLHRERHRDIECEDGPDEWIARANGAWQHAQDEARAAIEGGR